MHKLPPPRIAVPSLIEAARCLGIYQAEGNDEVAEYWEGMVTQLHRILAKALEENRPPARVDGT